MSQLTVPLTVYQLQDLRNVHRDMKIIIYTCSISIMGFEFMCELYLSSAIHWHITKELSSTERNITLPCRLTVVQCYNNCWTKLIIGL